MEIFELCKSMFVEDIDDYFENQEEKPKKMLLLEYLFLPNLKHLLIYY